MQEAAYRDWLAAQGKEPATQSTSISALRRIERAYGDLDADYELSGLETIAADLAYSAADRNRGEANPSKLAIDGDVYAGLSSARTHLNYYRRFLDSRETRAAAVEAVRAVPQPAVAAEEPEAVLSLERDLQAALRQSITQIEPGLTIIDGGSERTVASGRIDILARDAQGATVVIELKAVRAPRDAVAQVLAYMGDLDAEATGPVRGILIAPDFDPRALAAARMVPALRLMRFTFRFAFETLGPTA